MLVSISFLIDKKYSLKVSPIFPAILQARMTSYEFARAAALHRIRNRIINRWDE
jgi:hypothetical protein